MTITEPADPALPERRDIDVCIESMAAARVAEWLRGDPAVADELDEAVRAGVHREETRRRMEKAARTLAAARARVSSLMDKIDLEGRRRLPFSGGAIIVTALVVLDAIPLNWAAQAFGLNAADSWLVTMILLVASVGGMAGLEVTRHDARRRTVLTGILLAAYAGLVALRASYLVTVAGESMLAALLQAIVLSAISAGLVVLGSVVIGRTLPLRLSSARARARRAQRASEASEAAWHRADELFLRHLGILHRQMARQPLYASGPAGVAHADWVTALKNALRAHFTTTS